MKLSINFLKDYIDLPEDIDIKTIAEDMTSVGNEYDECGNLINATNLVIGEVLECEMHPDSDHLHVCKVDVGNEVLQIVCGAPNCRKGLKVIVALPGAKLPGGEIKKGSIRGVESNGMLCSIAELGLDSKFLTAADKEGIHELPADAKNGEDPIKYMGMDDGVIDFELTPNRGDLLSILGMAYEVGAIYGKKVKDIDLAYDETKDDFSKEFKVSLNTENATMYLAKKVTNVEIKESPLFIKNRLMACGIRPINNVVDISNYVMLETGQPLHFFDFDTLNGEIEVRMAKENEKMNTLDGQERILSTDDIVISNGKEPIALAGVMGGLETEITENTKNILIESAIFNSVKIRQTSNKILRSEASQRFEKGLDPNRTYMAIERCCNLLQKYAGATIIGGLAKVDNEALSSRKINITAKKINSILGLEIDEKEIISVFERLGFTVNKNGEGLEVEVPKRRLDISIEEDLVEEVGRIYGVDNIVGKLPNIPMKAGSYDKTTRQIRNKLVDLGLNETLSYILVNEKEVNQYNLDKNNEKIMLLAPMTEERNALRHSIIPSLYKIYDYNINHYNKDVSIFEIGKGFNKVGEEYGEESRLGVLMAGKFFQGIKEVPVDFYIIKGIAEEVLDFLGFKNRYSFQVKDNLPEELHPGKSALINVNGEDVGIIGRVNPEICKSECYILEINLDRLLSKKVGKMKYKDFSKFPETKKDLSIIVDENISAEEIEKAIKKSAGSTLTNIDVFDLYKGTGIAEGKKSIAFSLSFGTMDRTLTDDETNETMEKIILGLQKAIKAELRK